MKKIRLIECIKDIKNGVVKRKINKNKKKKRIQIQCNGEIKNGVVKRKI